MEFDDPVVFGAPERICPDGLVELVFHYGTPLACRYDGEDFASQPRSVAVSQTRRFVEIRPEGPCGMVSVRCQPWGAHHFFATPVSELADVQTPAEVLWGREALDLEERLAEAAEPVDRIALVESFLITQLQRYDKPDVGPLIRAVWRRRGQPRVAELCRELGIGERSLERTFANTLGTSPKAFMRLVRFLDACKQLRGCRGSTGEVGMACGYYDQSHFISEFKTFSGMTPGQFVDRSKVSFLEID